MHETMRVTMPKGRSGSILLVEDDEALARSLGRVIRQEGYEVEHAATGAAAIEAVMRTSFTAVVSDLHLPGTSGIDVLEIIRAYDPELPLVLMTGDPSTDTAIAACRLGVIDYLLKPMRREEVARVLLRATETQRASSARQEVAVQISYAKPAYANTLPSMGVVVPRKNEANPTLVATFERAMVTLSVGLEPIVDAARGLTGFAAIISSSEETLAGAAALVVAAERLDRLEELRRRARDLAVRAFADAPSGALLFVDVHHSDLLDGDLYSSDPPLARIADRVVLQLRASGAALALADLAARASVLRFSGFRFAIADLDGAQARLSQLADLAPEFVKIDPRVVRGIDTAPRRQRIVGALVSMCRSLDAVAIAEGVATAEERDALARAGCDLVQGPLVMRHAPSTRRALRAAGSAPIGSDVAEPSRAPAASGTHGVNERAGGPPTRRAGGPPTRRAAG